MITPESNEMNHNNPSGEISPLERVRFLDSLNALTRTILLSQDWNTTLHALVFDIRDLIGADDCYILGWDEERQWPIPIETTARLDFPFSEYTLGRDTLNITTSVLREERILTVEDTRSSPFMDIQLALQYPSL